METLLYGLFTTLWWLTSMSVFLPLVILLKISKSFRNHFFSFLFLKIIIPPFNYLILPLRKDTLELLKHEQAKAKPTRSSQPLEILEIGIGGGSNLPYYPENSVLTALDVNTAFEKYIRENAKKHSHVALKRLVHGRAEDMKAIPDASMDVVLGSYVLCSVDDVTRSLSEVKRVLKPGGMYVFLEHVAFPKSEWNYRLQKIVGPLWRLYFDGCNVDRSFENEIKNAGFSRVLTQRKCPVPLILYVRPQLYGFAVK